MNQARALGVALLAAVGVANSVAQVMELPWLASFARATVASPLPRAFSQSASFAAFADEFTIELTSSDGTVKRRTESSELYAGLPGPYERRIIYGTALSFGPASPLPVFTSILQYGFCRSGPLAVRMGAAQPLLSVAVMDGSRSTGEPRRLVVACAPDAGTR